MGSYQARLVVQLKTLHRINTYIETITQLYYTKTVKYSMSYD